MTDQSEQKSPPGLRPSSLIMALVPLVVFWVVESYAPLTTALIVAMVFGIGESAWSYWRHGAVDKLTLGSTVLVLITGGVGLWLKSGLLFKLKPAVIEGILAGVLLGSVALKKPLLLSMAKQQVGNIPKSREAYFSGVTVRMGLCFVLHTLLTVYAAIWLSTGAWIFVKGILSYGMLGVLVLFEMGYIRFVLRPRWEEQELEQAVTMTNRARNRPGRRQVESPEGRATTG